jgi:FixJ family two-component response regulator
MTTTTIQVRQLFRRGHPYKTIAQDLNISLKTVQRSIRHADSFDVFCRNYAKKFGLGALFQLMAKENSLERIGLLFGYTRERVRQKIMEIKLVS